MTTRSRFALVLGLAGLVVAGVQIAVLSDPPTVVQLVVVAFWSVVGVAYLGSAAAQRWRARRCGKAAEAAAPTGAAEPAAAPLEEIVPVPARSTRRRTVRPRLTSAPADRVVARTAAGPAAEPVAQPEPASEETTDAFTVRTVPDPAAITAETTATAATTGTVTADAPTAEIPVPSAARAVPDVPGFPAALSFGPARGRTVTEVSGSRRPTPPYGQPRVDAPAHRPAVAGSASLPIPVPSSSPVSAPLPVAPPVGAGADAAAPAGGVPAPRRARHRAEVADPAAGTGRGRHAAPDVVPTAPRGRGGEGR